MVKAPWVRVWNRCPAEDDHSTARAVRAAQGGRGERRQWHQRTCDRRHLQAAWPGGPRAGCRPAECCAPRLGPPAAVFMHARRQNDVSYNSTGISTSGRLLPALRGPARASRHELGSPALNLSYPMGSVESEKCAPRTPHAVAPRASGSRSVSHPVRCRALHTVAVEQGGSPGSASHLTQVTPRYAARTARGHGRVLRAATAAVHTRHCNGMRHAPPLNLVQTHQPRCHPPCLRMPAPATAPRNHGKRAPAAHAKARPWPAQLIRMLVGMQLPRAAH